MLIGFPSLGLAFSQVIDLSLYDKLLQSMSELTCIEWIYCVSLLLCLQGGKEIGEKEEGGRFGNNQ